MPLIVEDGTMPAGANSYVSLESADAYLVPRGLWPAHEGKADNDPTDDGDNESVEEPDTTVEPTEPDSGSDDSGLANSQSEDGEIEETDGEGDGPDSELPDNTESEPDAELPDTGKPDDNPQIAKKETALVRAFDYLDMLKWKGQRIDWQRQVAWPRKNVPVPGSCPNTPEFVANDIVPDVVRKAQMELAALIYNGVDMFKPLERGGQYQSSSDSYSKSVDVLSKSESHSVAYAANAPRETWLPSVYPLLRDFLDEVPGETSGFTVQNILRG